MPARGQGVHLPSEARKVGLPTRVFLFTLDQLEVMLDLDEKALKTHIFYEGRSIGTRHKKLMVARNIAADNESPDWRVSEREFVRWMKHKGFRHYARGEFW